MNVNISAEAVPKFAYIWNFATNFLSVTGHSAVRVAQRGAKSVNEDLISQPYTEANIGNN